jgi:hypothetical protein
VPLLPGKANHESNFKELRQGKTFARTQRKFGTAKARQQMIAIELSNERKTAGAIHRAGRK